MRAAVGGKAALNQAFGRTEILDQHTKACFPGSIRTQRGTPEWSGLNGIDARAEFDDESKPHGGRSDRPVSREEPKDVTLSSGY